jgi:hypothetical protein
MQLGGLAGITALTMGIGQDAKLATDNDPSPPSAK